MIVSITAIFIQEINPGEYSLIHLLIPWTIGSLIYSIWNIRKYRETKLPRHKHAHMYSMIGVYIGALIVAGAFTLMPGRFFHSIFFGWWLNLMTKSKINLKSKLESIKDYWSPKVIAELNDYQFKLAKIKDEFIWHEHNDTDEAFMVI